ncbi:DNA invertase Pin-like site-specific DNA recombinase [Williamsia muralis]|uniref:DNA invertase Pin-like site-specific DNA recombinase n=1 Tax=Williamsia marianensis TaxID=85044 RepID=A0A495K4N0_WILMA|nr:recombinase family protein [Williamsia muralis]RKR96237.1 DNA invertase Pin-like site-specific DNA recombinase [Williamsia muralis]
MSVSAGVYVRISRDKVGNKAGVERQTEDCQELATRLGWDVLNVYEDNDISAYSGKKRPGYEAMLSDIQSGLIDGVLAWHTDRLHRSMNELERFIEIVTAHGVEIGTVQGGEIDLSTASGRMLARILGSVARQESEHKGERIRRARQQQATRGGWHGGRRCFGYEADGMTVRRDEAAEVLRMANAIISGLSLRAVVSDLKAREVPTAGGGAWTSTTVRELLSSPRVAGLSSYKGKVVAQASWPALIPEELWRGVVALFSDPSRKTNYVGGAVKWLGSGLYRCGVCGSLDVRVGTVEGRKRYRCRNRTPDGPRVHVGRDAVLLDAYVEDLVVARLSRPDFAVSLPSASAEIDVVELREKRSILTLRLDQLAQAFADGNISLSVLTTASTRLETEVETIASTLAKSASQSAFADVYGTDDIRSLWQAMNLEKKRTILDALVTVTINPTKSGRTTDGTYFRHEDIGIDWKVLSSDG